MAGSIVLEAQPVTLCMVCEDNLLIGRHWVAICDSCRKMMNPGYDPSIIVGREQPSNLGPVIVDLRHKPWR